MVNEADEVVENDEIIEAEQKKQKVEVNQEQISEKLDKILSDSNNKSKIIRKLTNRLNTLEEQLTGKEEEKPEKPETSPSEIMEKFKAKQQQTEMKHQKRARLHEIRSALEANGLDSAKSKRFAKLIEMEEGENFELTSDDDYGDYEVIGYKESDEIIPVNEWMKVYLESDRGSAFRPSVKGPTPNIDINRTRNKTSSGKKKISSMDFSKLIANMSREERKAVVDKYEII